LNDRRPPAAVSRVQAETPDLQETTVNRAHLARTDNQAHLDRTHNRRTQFCQLLTSALAQLLLDPGDRRDPQGHLAIMGSRVAPAPTVNRARQVLLDPLVPTEETANRDQRDRLETTAIRRLEERVQKVHLDRPAPLDNQAPVANLDQMASPADLAHLEHLATKEPLEIQADPAPMARLVALATQAHLDPAHNVRQLVWLLAINRLVDSQTSLPTGQLLLM